MGRKNKSYRRDLKQQMSDRLLSMCHFGESKREAKINGIAQDKIFSYRTLQSYLVHCKKFAEYVRREHPEVTTLDSARKYVYEWLDCRSNWINPRTGEHLSAWTIQTEAKALGKLYGITPDDDDYFTPPERHRYDIKRSRAEVERDRFFSVEKNKELVDYCRATGFRREEITNQKGGGVYPKEKITNLLSNQDLIESDERFLLVPQNLRESILKDALLFKEDNFVLIRGKGGKWRLVPIIGEKANDVIERINNTPSNRKVWEYVNTYADIHSFRSDYAVRLYKKYSRPIEEIEKSLKGDLRREIYFCRNDERGKKLDKKAMLLVSKALGHNRIDIVAENYLRGI